MISDIQVERDEKSLEALRQASEQLTKAAVRDADSLIELDQAHREHLDAIMQRYAYTQQIAVETEEPMWQTVDAYLKAVITAYSTFLQKPAARLTGFLASKLLLHAMHHLALMAKWHYYRYQPLPQGVWRLMHRLYQHAETLSTGDGAIEIASHERRYLQALMLDTVNLGNMLKSEIDMVDRWLRHWCQDVRLETECDEARHLFQVDLEEDRSARRIRDFTTEPNYRYWQLDTVTSHIDQMRRQLAAGKLPLEFDVHGNLSNATRLVDQLLTEWSRVDYRRQRRTESRQEVAKRAKASHGILNICQHVKNIEFSAEKLSAAQEYNNDSGWLIENESKFGLGAVANASLNNWLEPGRLIALDYELNPAMTLVGVVRSVKQHDWQSVYVGVDIFSHAPTYVRLQYVSQGGSLPEAGLPFPALYLARDDDRELPPNVILPLTDYVQHGLYSLRLQQYWQQLRLGNVIEQRGDWVRAAAVIQVKPE